MRSFGSSGITLLIEGAYAASQTYGPDSSVMTALPMAAELLIYAAMVDRARLRRRPR
jgi:hypothetical protein